MNKNIDFGNVSDLYDIYAQWEVDIPFFQNICAGVRSEVLELMSGTGRLSLPLLRSGVRLCCVDYSAEMLGVLRQKLSEHGLVADIHEQDVRSLDLGRRFELILLPFHSLSEIIDPEDRIRALNRIHQHLTPGGRFIVTLHNPAAQIPRLDGERRMICDAPIPGRDARLRVWSTAAYHADSAIGEARQEYEIFDNDGLLETRELSLRFAVIDRETFEHEASEAGFRVVNLWGDYSSGPFDPQRSPTMIWELSADERKS